MKIKRDNKIIDVNYTLKTKNEIIKNEKFKEPRYIIFEVFLELEDEDFLNELKDCPF